LLVAVAGSVLVVFMLRWIPPPTSSFMVQSHFRGQATEQAKNPHIRYTWVAYGDISPQMALAVVAAEDQRFPTHGGFDFTEIKEALRARFQGKPLRGASTITQQVAKNLFLWPQRSLLRKGLEAWFTMLIETLWPKRRILEVYLNIAQFGHFIFGVEEASRRFFNKPAVRLSRQEAALLAAVLPNPDRYQVQAPSPYVRTRQAWILRQMRRLGGIQYIEDFAPIGSTAPRAGVGPVVPGASRSG
jgi:monofunctional biosynthetic peptidoglycan transglycosylase